MKLSLRVQPGAKRSALLARLASGEWKVAVSAPPVEGRANDAVVELVCELLGVKRRQVSFTRGEASRSKVLEITGITESEAESKLAAVLESSGKNSQGSPGKTSDKSTRRENSRRRT